MAKEKEPMSIVAYVFSDADAANAGLKELKGVKKTQNLKYADAAVLVKEEGGKIHIKETDDMSGGMGATWGAVVGGLTGLLGGPIGLLAGGAVGAAIGGVWAHFRDSGIDNDELKQMAEALGAGNSALLVLVPQQEAVMLSQAMGSTASGQAARSLTLNTSQDVETITATFKQAVDTLAAAPDTPSAAE